MRLVSTAPSINACFLHNAPDWAPDQKALTGECNMRNRDARRKGWPQQNDVAAR
jgi:hypothetical protein